MKGPGLYSDIGKKAKDLLTKDYNYDHKLTMSTRSASGVALTSAAVKKGGLFDFDIGTVYKYKSTTIDVKVDTNSNITSILTCNDLLPSTKTIATLKLPDYSAGKVEVQYFHDHATVASTVALKQSPVVDFSATVGAHGVVIGAEAGFDTASGNFTKYSAAVGLTKPDYTVSVTLGDMGDSIKGSYVHHLDEKQKSAVVGEITRRFSTNENTFCVGGLYELDPLTTVKTKLNTSGMFGVALLHQVMPTSTLTISSMFDTKALEKTPKFGLALALKP